MDGQKPAETANSSELGAIDGIILDLHGAPLRKAIVTLAPSQNERTQQNRSYSSVSDSEGHFSLESVEPGTYRLWAERSGFLRQNYGGHGPEDWGTGVKLAPGQRLSGVVLQMTPAATLTGRVVDEDDDPVGDVDAVAFRYSYALGVRRAQVVALGQTDSAGEFKVIGIAPGRYYVVAVPLHVGTVAQIFSPQNADKAEYSYTATYYPNVTDAAGAQQITVLPGGSQSIGDLKLRRTRVFHVRGQVRDDAHMRKGHIVIRAAPADSRWAVGLTNMPSAEIALQDGSFDILGVPPGSYTLMVTAAVGQLRILGRQDVEVREGDVNKLTVDLTPGVEVAGTIAYADPEPNSGSTSKKERPGPIVSLSPTDPVLLSSPGKRIMDGSFKFPDVSPARYRVRVTDTPEDEYLQGIKSSGGEDLIANDLDLSSGGVSQNLILTFKRAPASIDGTVQDADGNHLADIAISLAPRPLDLHQTHRYRRVFSNKDGHFTFAGLAPGDYCVYVWDRLGDGEEFDSALLEQSAGSCQHVRIEENEKKSLDLTFRQRTD